MKELSLLEVLDREYEELGKLTAGALADTIVDISTISNEKEPNVWSPPFRKLAEEFGRLNASGTLVLPEMSDDEEEVEDFKISVSTGGLPPSVMTGQNPGSSSVITAPSFQSSAAFAVADSGQGSKESKDGKTAKSKLLDDNEQQLWAQIKARMEEYAKIKWEEKGIAAQIAHKRKTNELYGRFDLTKADAALKRTEIALAKIDADVQNKKNKSVLAHVLAIQKHYLILKAITKPEIIKERAAAMLQPVVGHIEKLKMLAKQVKKTISPTKLLSQFSPTKILSQLRDDPVVDYLGKQLDEDFGGAYSYALALAGWILQCAESTPMKEEKKRKESAQPMSMEIIIDLLNKAVDSGGPSVAGTKTGSTAASGGPSLDGMKAGLTAEKIARHREDILAAMAKAVLKRDENGRVRIDQMTSFIQLKAVYTLFDELCKLNPTNLEYKHWLVRINFRIQELDRPDKFFGSAVEAWREVNKLSRYSAILAAAALRFILLPGNSERDQLRKAIRVVKVPADSFSFPEEDENFYIATLEILQKACVYIQSKKQPPLLHQDTEGTTIGDLRMCAGVAFLNVVKLSWPPTEEQLRRHGKFMEDYSSFQSLEDVQFAAHRDAFLNKQLDQIEGLVAQMTDLSTEQLFLRDSLAFLKVASSIPMLARQLSFLVQHYATTFPESVTANAYQSLVELDRLYNEPGYSAGHEAFNNIAVVDVSKGVRIEELSAAERSATPPSSSGGGQQVDGGKPEQNITQVKQIF